MSCLISNKAQNTGIHKKLFSAVEAGDWKKVKGLVKNKFLNINVQNFQGDTPLTVAAANRLSKVVRVLVTRKDLDVNCRGSGGATALKHAAFNKDLATLKALQKHHGFNPNIKDNLEIVPLLNAIAVGHVEFALELLNASGIDVNVQPKEKDSMLHMLFSSKIIQLKNKKKLFNRLLELGTDTTSQGFSKENIPKKMQSCLEEVTKRKQTYIQQFIPYPDISSLILKF